MAEHSSADEVKQFESCGSPFCRLNGGCREDDRSNTGPVDPVALWAAAKRAVNISVEDLVGPADPRRADVLKAYYALLPLIREGLDAQLLGLDIDQQQISETAPVSS